MEDSRTGTEGACCGYDHDKHYDCERSRVRDGRRFGHRAGTKRISGPDVLFLLHLMQRKV